MLEAAVRMAGTSGSMRQYCILGSILNRSGTAGNTLPTAELVAKGKLELKEMAVRLMQTIHDLKRQAARVVDLDPDQIPHWQDFFDVKLTFDVRQATKHCSQAEVMITFLP